MQIPRFACAQPNSLTIFQIFEQSQLAEEIGAAIHITPNADSILRRLGVRHEEKGAVKLLQVCFAKQNHVLNTMTFLCMTDALLRLQVQPTQRHP